MPHRRTFLLPLLLAFVALLQGCSLSRSQIRRADYLVAASADANSDCRQADRCAIDSPLLDAADQALAASTPARPQHVVALLGDSEPALAARLSLIRAAKHSIDVQTYIWDEDDAGKLMLDELVQAARRGVKVRILADQLGSFDDLALLDRLARVHANFQVRLYNPTFQKAHTAPVEWAAGILCCFLNFNQRMHNKVLLVDDAAGITGGRNYQNRYFDWDDDFDYVDRDVLVGGPAARAMASSFALFWQHKRAVPLTHLRDVNRHILDHPAPPGWPPPQYDHPQRVYRVQQEAEDTEWLRAHVLAHSIRTGQVDFFSDLPAKTEQPRQRDARAFTRRVMQMVGSARSEVVLQTPYLVMSKRARRIFERLHAQRPPPRIVVSTNSLASTDAFAVYAMSYKHRKRYLKKYGFEIYELKPHALGPAEANAWASMEWHGAAAPAARTGEDTHVVDVETRGLLGSRGSRNRPAPLVSEGRRFGLHAKSIVVDDAFAMVGSHNFDPRSDHYNTEAGVIVYDRRFADQLRSAIMRDTAPQNAWVIAPRRPVVPVLTDINQAIGDISESLPLFDFWPYRYATSYELKDGCTPMRPSDPAFFSCYKPVGDFPDVALSFKLIYTRLITAFGVGATGIL
ncbi:phospholipase [Frateuria sp. Soil773]|uniref:phospholipase D-like domain-containing protein n=1 Tax=Frateuria sp. Soil773 TaxID=1736407 RepID=UPI0006F64520|nr:phospholipase D family protein [Frateuria sp. Soil773]KRF00603.1 phospholipase [Frateuria sp. Soil773]